METNNYAVYQAVPNMYYTFNPDCLGYTVKHTCEDVACWVKCADCPYGQYGGDSCDIASPTTCTDCVTFQGRYLLPGRDCNDIRLWTVCTPCTPVSEYTLDQQTGKLLLNACPPFQNNMGYTTKANVVCKPCVSCIGDVYYFAGEQDQVTCVTEPERQCIYTYRDESGKAWTTPMPFVWGKARMHGQYYADVNSNGVGDTLPQYSPCANWATVSVGYIANPLVSSAGLPWSSDCDVQKVLLCFLLLVLFFFPVLTPQKIKVGMCAQGYYYKLQDGTCNACPNEGQSTPAGFSAHCNCSSGYARQDQVIFFYFFGPSLPQRLSIKLTNQSGGGGVWRERKRTVGLRDGALLLVPGRDQPPVSQRIHARVHDMSWADALRGRWSVRERRRAEVRTVPRRCLCDEQAGRVPYVQCRDVPGGERVPGM